MLCSPCTNGGYRTFPSAVLSTLLLQSASLFVEWPRHLTVSSLCLSSELLSAVLAFLPPLLLVPVISSASVLLLIQWMLSLGYCMCAEIRLHLPDSARGWILLPMLILLAYPLHHLPIHCLSICSDLFLISLRALVAKSISCHSSSPSGLSVLSNCCPLCPELDDISPACTSSTVGLQNPDCRIYALLWAFDVGGWTHLLGIPWWEWWGNPELPPLMQYLHPVSHPHT